MTVCRPFPVSLVTTVMSLDPPLSLMHTPLHFSILFTSHHVFVSCSGAHRPWAVDRGSTCLGSFSPLIIYFLLLLFYI